MAPLKKTAQIHYLLLLSPSICYYISKNTWSRNSPFAFLVTGGYGALELVQRLDLATGTWTRLADLQPVRAQHGCALVELGGRSGIIVVGGDSGGTRLNDVRQSSDMHKHFIIYSKVVGAKQSRRCNHCLKKDLGTFGTDPQSTMHVFISRFGVQSLLLMLFPEHKCICFMYQCL